MKNYYIELICDKCGNSYTISKSTYRNRLNNNTPNYCKSCMNTYRIEKLKETWNNKSDEEKERWSQQTKNQLAKRSKEEWDIINKKNSEGLKKHWETVSKEDKDKRVSSMLKANKDKLDNMTKEEKSKRAKDIFNNMDETARKKMLENSRKRMIKYNNSLSYEEKLKRVNMMNDANRNKSKEEKDDIYKRSHQWYHDLSNEDKQKYAQLRIDWYNSLSKEEKEKLYQSQSSWYNNLSEDDKKKYAQSKRDWYFNLSINDKEKYAQTRLDWYNSLSKEEKERISRLQKDAWLNMSLDKKEKIIHDRLINGTTNNNFNKKFENYFNNSMISNNYYIKPEIVLENNSNTHSWDYGIYDKDNNLVAVVDLDGSFYHADNCDYDGLHSKEEYDDKRSLSIPEDSKIKIFIIPELNFIQSFKYMIENLIINYDEYIESIFRMCREIPFPYPKYSDRELIKSYNDLCRMNCDDKYHKDISLNTRIGDHLINHFHESIYQAHRNNELSPYQAWYDDKLLRKVIENRIIYQVYLNPNKILQGFNVSKIAQKVSVFSAGRAKMLIYRYLKQYDTIFDPFSGFSGRMLGTISLGKRYIGQDLSSLHVKESKMLLKFIKDNFDDIDAIITKKNIFESTGTYDCLFTCPPYADKEQWVGVKKSNISCDDWIDICIDRFKCKTYLFVVDETTKYKDYIVDTITNRSHMNKNNEYIIKIDREG